MAATVLMRNPQRRAEPAFLKARPRIEAMHRLNLSGSSQEEVGRAFGVTASRVSQSWAGLPDADGWTHA